MPASFLTGCVWQSRRLFAVTLRLHRTVLRPLPGSEEFLIFVPGVSSAKGGLDPRLMVVTPVGVGSICGVVEFERIPVTANGLNSHEFSYGQGSLAHAGPPRTVVARLDIWYKRSHRFAPPRTTEVISRSPGS